MPQPTPGDVHVDRPLTNMSVAYIQTAADFIADKVFPVLPVSKQSDRYFKYNKGDWFRSDMQKRAPGAESAGSGYTIDNTPSYFCDVWALHKDVDDQTRANTDEPLDADRDATRWLSQQGMVRKELEFASKYFTTGLWTGSTTNTDIAVTTKWDATGSDPVDDVEEQKDGVQTSSGYLPNVMVVTPTVYRALKNNASILDRIKYTQRAVVTADLLAGLFGVDKFLVARAVKNTAKEGQTASMSYVFGTEGALLVYAAPSPSLMVPSGGYIFTWSGLFGATAGQRIKKFRLEQYSSDRVEIEATWDMKVVAPDVGAFFSDVLT